jgi:centrin-3
LVQQAQDQRLHDFFDISQTYLSSFVLPCRELGEEMSDEELRAMIDEFDKDQDGESKRMNQTESIYFQSTPLEDKC